jgi:hypothetical protein
MTSCPSATLSIVTTRRGMMIVTMRRQPIVTMRRLRFALHERCSNGPTVAPRCYALPASAGDEAMHRRRSTRA